MKTLSCRITGRGGQVVAYADPGDGGWVGGVNPPENLNFLKTLFKNDLKEIITSLNHSEIHIVRERE